MSAGRPSADARRGVRYRVVHTTRYHYDEGATLCANQAHLLPRSLPTQTVHRAALTVEPTPDDVVEHTDAFGNRVTFFAVERPHDALVVTAVSEVTVGPGRGTAAPGLDRPWEELAAAPVPIEAAPFRFESPLVPPLPELVELARPSFPPGATVGEALTDLTRRIHAELAYEPGFTEVSTPLADVLLHRRGVCQDFAHVAVGCLRAMGLATRYVSGYLETVPPPGQPKLVGADASHAWCGVRLEDGSWLDLDPTNDLVAPTTHVTVAVGRDYGDVVPVKGVVQSTGGTTRLDVEVDVSRLDDGDDDGERPGPA